MANPQLNGSKVRLVKFRDDWHKHSKSELWDVKLQRGKKARNWRALNDVAARLHHSARTSFWRRDEVLSHVRHEGSWRFRSADSQFIGTVSRLGKFATGWQETGGKLHPPRFYNTRLASNVQGQSEGNLNACEGTKGMPCTSNSAWR